MFQLRRHLAVEVAKRRGVSTQSVLPYRGGHILQSHQALTVVSTYYSHCGASLSDKLQACSSVTDIGTARLA